MLLIESIYTKLLTHPNFEKIFLDNHKNLGNTYIFTHSVFIDKSVYSCNNEEDEGEIPQA